MDPRRFDSLARALAEPKSRRGLIGGLAALGAGLLGARGTDAQITQAQCGNKVCAARPGICTNGCVCCVWGNGNSRCVPPGNCTGTVTSPATTTTQAPTTAAPTTTQAPTTTAPTTTQAPTTTAAPGTTTTTTTARPAGQGTCQAGQNSCAGSDFCNGTSVCICVRTTSGTTVCGFAPSIVPSTCTADAQCSAFGPGAVCATCPGGNTCILPCPL